MEVKNEIKRGCLYVVGTPIGNLSDITERAVHTLENADFIAAEDTRVTGSLLSKLGVVRKSKRLVSYREHNAVSKGGEIAERLKAGESCAIVTDAGMPCISDPGEDLVKLCRESDIPVYVVPGPCALTSALAVSGLSTKRFSFEGFLSVSKKQRSAHLNSLKDSRHTLIFYEAPHKLKNTLSDLYAAFGDRRMSVCRELTKVYEEVLQGRISEMLELFSADEKTPRGEFVLVVEGAPDIAEPADAESALRDAVTSALQLHEEGMSLSRAAKAVCDSDPALKSVGVKKSVIYKELLLIKAKENHDE